MRLFRTKAGAGVARKGNFTGDPPSAALYSPFAAVFCDPLKYPEGRRNQLWSMFMDPERRRRSTDWEAGARSQLARFRADNARHLGDPDFEELIDDLREGSEEFRCWWKRHEVARSGTGRKAFRHPELGKLWFEHAVFKLEENPEQRLILYSPLPKCNTPEKLEQLLIGTARS